MPDLFSQPQGFPLTRLICDLIRVQTGSLTMPDIRKRWSDGAYAGVRDDLAKAYVEEMR
jgi:hypothetical protein